MSIIRATAKRAEQALRDTDWDRIDAMTDKDIAAQVASNPDAAPLLEEVDVRAVRKSLGLDQRRFAALIDVPHGTLLNWEYGRHAPSGAARVLLTLLSRNPRAVLASLYPDIVGPAPSAEIRKPGEK